MMNELAAKNRDDAAVAQAMEALFDEAVRGLAVRLASGAGPYPSSLQSRRSWSRT